MTTWDKALPDMPLDGLKPFYDWQAESPTDARRELHGDRKHVRQSDKRVAVDARRLDNALQHLGCLPAPGESFHLITHGNYSLWHIVRAVLALGAPATIAYLGITTLGFNRYNLEELTALLDGGKIGRLDFLYSLFFKSNEREICERLTHELTTRGHRVLVMRTHAKILLLELTDGRAPTVESSANLRSCSNIEQITLTNDPALLAFHRGWINELLTEHTP